jgi:DNA-binding PadR family transcriptional regulator
MDASSQHPGSADDEAESAVEGDQARAAPGLETEDDALASDRDAAGIPIHRGWAPLGGRRRWMEPFVLVLLAGGGAHGYAITAQLEEMGITGGAVDIGQVYRTLRDLEEAGQVTSSWSAEPVGPQRRDYELTDAGYTAIDEWAAVMKERARLIAEFNARYLEAVAGPRKHRSSAALGRSALR